MTYVGKTQYNNQIMRYSLSDGYWLPISSTGLSSLLDVLNTNNYTSGKDIEISAGDKISYTDGYIAGEAGGIKIKGDLNILDGKINNSTGVEFSVAGTQRFFIDDNHANFNFGINDIQIYDGIVSTNGSSLTIRAPESVTLSAYGLLRLSVDDTEALFNFGTNDIRILDGVISGSASLNLAVGSTNKFTLSSSSGIFNFGTNDISILDGAISGQTSLNLSVAAANKFTLTTTDGTFNFGSNDIKISDGTINGQTSLNLSTGGTNRLSLTSTKGTFNFGNDDVEVGNNYISVAASTVTSGQLRIKSQDGYVAMATRYPTNSLDTRILSFYGSKLRLGDLGSGTTYQAMPKVLIDASEAISMAIGSRTGEDANTGLEVTSFVVSVKNPLAVRGDYISIGSTPSTVGNIKGSYGLDFNVRNYENNADCPIINIIDESGSVWFGSSSYLRSVVNGGTGQTILASAKQSIFMVAGDIIIDLINNRINFEKPITHDTEVKTISAGVISVSAGFVLVDTEGGAASDDLNTINNGEEGQILYLKTVNSARDVKLTEIGNIKIGGGTTLTITDSDAVVSLIYYTKWYVTGYSGGCILA